MTTFNNGHWSFSEQLNYLKAQGFVYLIVAKSSGRLYIGKKNFRSEGKLTKGRQSNWRTYTGSSDKLNALIKAVGVSKFSFYVLEQYYTKGGVGWAETWSQCYAETASNHDKFFNVLIEKVCWRSTEHITVRHKDRLNKLLTLVKR